MSLVRPLCPQERTFKPHVRIVRVGDPTELKLVSVSALLERYDFALE